MNDHNIYHISYRNLACIASPNPILNPIRDPNLNPIQNPIYNPLNEPYLNHYRDYIPTQSPDLNPIGSPFFNPNGSPILTPFALSHTIFKRFLKSFIVIVLKSVTILINTSFPLRINLCNLIHKIFPIGIAHLHNIILIRLLFYVITVQGPHFQYHFAFIRNQLTIIFNPIFKYFVNHFG